MLTSVYRWTTPEMRPTVAATTPAATPITTSAMTNKASNRPAIVPNSGMAWLGTGVGRERGR
jgi:hypothetical protein